MMLKRIGTLWAAAGLLSCAIQAQDTDVKGFEARVYRYGADKAMRYRLFVPPAYDASQKFPLVIWLHGIDAVGSDNVKQITSFNYAGSHTWTQARVQEKHPCFVLAPQLPFGGTWGLPLTNEPSGHLLRVLDIMRLLEREFSIDEGRIYVVGQSLGGMGTWSIVAARPELFAAAVPVCGAGNIFKAKELAKVPIWAFHALDDPIVPVIGSKTMVDAVRKAGGTVKYTEYKSGLHNAWDRAFNDPDMIEWLFAQKRGSQPSH